MLCQFLLYSKVNQLYIYTYPLFFGFPSHLGHHRTLRRVPCAIQQVLAVFANSFSIWKQYFKITIWVSVCSLLLLVHCFQAFKMKRTRKYFFFLAAPRGLLDPSSATGIKPAPSAVKAWSPNHWTTREFPRKQFFLR